MTIRTGNRDDIKKDIRNIFFDFSWVNERKKDIGEFLFKYNTKSLSTLTFTDLNINTSVVHIKIVKVNPPCVWGKQLSIEDGHLHNY